MSSGNVARESQIEIQNNLQAHDLKASFLMNSKFYSFHLCIFPLTFLGEGVGETPAILEQLYDLFLQFQTAGS